MEVLQFEPQGRNAKTVLYTYDATRDLLQLSNDIIYRLNGDRDRNIPEFNKFMEDFDMFSLGSSEVLTKVNIFLGKLGLPDEIPSTQKESLWVL